jgi:hypothetical protein
VAVALSGVMALALYQGPPVALDPLTGHWSYRIAAGHSAAFSGAVTGGDYVTGNFTVIDPPGALVLFGVYNASSYWRLAHGLPATPAQGPGNSNHGLIDFSALYTDTYCFVWTNPYPASSGIAITVYAKTSYMSNVVVA